LDWLNAARGVKVIATDLMSTKARDAHDWRTRFPDGKALDGPKGVQQFRFFYRIFFFLIDPYACIR